MIKREKQAGMIFIYNFKQKLMFSPVLHVSFLQDLNSNFAIISEMLLEKYNTRNLKYYGNFVGLPW